MTKAGIKHILASSREQGHCYLTESQIIVGTTELLGDQVSDERIQKVLSQLQGSNQIKSRRRDDPPLDAKEICFSSKTFYLDELKVALVINRLIQINTLSDILRIKAWVDRYCEKHNLTLIQEQKVSICRIADSSFSILTGGPGCGKTTTTKVLVEPLTGS